MCTRLSSLWSDFKFPKDGNVATFTFPRVPHSCWRSIASPCDCLWGGSATVFGADCGCSAPNKGRKMSHFSSWLSNLVRQSWGLPGGRQVSDSQPPCHSLSIPPHTTSRKPLRAGSQGAPANAISQDALKGSGLTPQCSCLSGQQRPTSSRPPSEPSASSATSNSDHQETRLGSRD